jgi:uncharacterized protein (TIGR00725 family)
MVKQIRLGVFGSASCWTKEAEPLAIQVGEIIASLGIIMITGATSGLPHIAAQAALAKNGTVIGISPAKNAQDHQKIYNRPLNGCSHIIWTGGGFTARNYLNVRNCDGAIFIGGEAGTLEEFCIAWAEEKIIGVLENSGGVSEIVRDVVKVFSTPRQSEVFYDARPEQLVSSIYESIKRSFYL